MPSQGTCVPLSFKEAHLPGQVRQCLVGFESPVHILRVGSGGFHDQVKTLPDTQKHLNFPVMVLEILLLDINFFGLIIGSFPRHSYSTTNKEPQKG